MDSVCHISQELLPLESNRLPVFVAYAAKGGGGGVIAADVCLSAVLGAPPNTNGGLKQIIRSLNCEVLRKNYLFSTSWK